MFKVTVNGKEPIAADLKKTKDQFEGTLGDALVKGDLLKINDQQYNLIHNHKSYNIEVLKVSAEDKTMVLRVDSKKFTVQLQDKYDLLLHSLGMDNLAAKKVNEVKAPMPGMVLKILINEGDQVKKGDALLVLEAMKMENIIKSPADGLVKKINAVQGTAVEKNQVLIQF
jgi:biotin carboxyl carrier protein